MAEVRNMKEFCRQIPKVELHAHLNGSISVTTLNNLLTSKQRIDADVLSMTEWKGETLFTQENFSKGFEVFSAIHQLVDNDDAVKQVTKDVIKEFAEENVKYLELRSTPKTNAAKGLTKRSYLDSVVSAIEESQRLIPHIIVRFLVSVDRKRGLDEAMENVELAIEYQNKTAGLVCGVDFSGDPCAYHSRDFVSPLTKAKKSGLKLSLHIAEVPNIDDSKVLLELLPDRIGHGTCLHPDQGGSRELMNIVEQHKIPLELCLTSNVKCHTVTSYDDHHMWYWYKANHPFTLATDDKGIFMTTLSQEYEIMMDTLNLSPSQVWNLSYRAIDDIFADELVKKHLRGTWNKEKQDLDISD